MQGHATYKENKNADISRWDTYTCLRSYNYQFLQYKPKCKLMILITINCQLFIAIKSITRLLNICIANCNIFNGSSSEVSGSKYCLTRISNKPFILFEYQQLGPKQSLMILYYLKIDPRIVMFWAFPNQNCIKSLLRGFGYVQVEIYFWIRLWHKAKVFVLGW